MSIRVLVSGSSGLVGSALVSALRTAGHDVKSLVRSAATTPDQISVPGRSAALGLKVYQVRPLGVVVATTVPGAGGSRTTEPDTVVGSTGRAKVTSKPVATETRVPTCSVATTEPVVAARREPAELSANGLTWIHLDSPDPETATELAERFGWHPLDVEDVMSRRQRPKVDHYNEDDGAGYVFAVLHFPVYDKAISRLNAGELDVFLGPDYLVTLPNVELLPVTRLFSRCYEDRELRTELTRWPKASTRTG